MQKDVIGYEGLYTVDDKGIVRNCRGKVVGRTTVYGYRSVQLRKNGISKHYLVHCLVLEAFMGPRPEGLQTRHLDGNKQNNSLINLVWGTPKENSDDKLHHGTHYTGEKTSSYKGKLTTEDVRNIREASKKGKRATELANQYNVSVGYMRSVINGRKWAHIDGYAKRKTNGQMLEVH